MRNPPAACRRRWLAPCILLAPFPLAWLLYYSMDDGTRPVCVFRLLTGKPCMFCGVTHAFAHAMHGEWGHAMAYHPFWFVMALALVASAGYMLVRPEGLGQVRRFCGSQWLALSVAVAVLSALRAWLLPIAL